VKIKMSAHGGKNKNKNLFFYLALPISLAVLFVFFSECMADVGENPIISAVQIKGIHANDDFIEIYNPGCTDRDISNWKLRKRIGSGTESSIKVISDGTILHAKSYFLWSNSDVADMVKADQSTGATLSENYSIALIDNEEIIDSITWGANSHSFSGTHLYPENPTATQVLKKDINNNFKTELNYSPKNSSFTNSSELDLCPKKEPEPKPEPKTYSNKIQITELLPYPDDGDEEYVELYNGSDEKIELGGWSLHDASKSGEYIFSSADSINPKEYLAVYGSKYKFALNNSGDESVTLYDPNKTEVFSILYNGSKKGISYNFDGKDWRWSKFLTPGKENVFEKIPAGELNFDNNVYVNVYANFEILGLSDDAKVDWDFGDDHSSYLQKTRHKYSEIGKYAASVKYSEGSDDVIENFTVNVEKVSHPEVKIVAINANPKGSDTGNETITLENKSKKKVNLNGWSIATGWEKLSNHPISEDFIIKAGKEKEITGEFSKFTLNNKKTKIELRYPDGEVAYDVKYNKKKGSVAEDEAYVKEKKGWTWILKAPITKLQDTKNNQDTATNIQEAPNDEQKNTDDGIGNIPDEAMITQTKIERGNKLALNHNSIFKIELADSAPQVLGAETVREVDGVYFFTPKHPRQEHYAVAFAKNMFVIINLKINTLINYFFD
jgi:hypothetical protein